MTETSSSNQQHEAETQRNLIHRILGAVVGLIATTMPSTFSFRSLGSFLLLVVAPLLVGWWLAQSLVPQPVVGIIRLDTAIWAGSARLAMAQIQAARQDPSIKAVVLQLDSPGGEVAATQALYLELQSLRREMPVVSSIDGMAASGAFYVAMATDPIYVKPSSSVGSLPQCEWKRLRVVVNARIALRVDAMCERVYFKCTAR